MPGSSDAEAWLRFAHDDLAAARRLLGDHALPGRIACFHAQQATEKALKALLVDADIPFGKTHDLIVLCELQAEPVRSQLKVIGLQELQPWAVDARYPADLPEVTADEATALADIAGRILELVTKAFRADT